MALTSSRVVLNWIDGTRVGEPDIRQSINPATYEVIGEYADGASRQRGRPSRPPGARSAKRAGWWITSCARVLGQLAEAFERNRDALLDLLATENGKVKGEAAFELDMVPPKLRYYAAAALLESGRAVTPKPGSISLILRQPMGVAETVRRRAVSNSPALGRLNGMAALPP
jgi:betaine-aldehyde dehydrogenase